MYGLMNWVLSTHFGFKSLEDGLIEDWKKVGFFCQECEHAISYTENTSNLAYYLENNHPFICKVLKESQQIGEQC